MLSPIRHNPGIRDIPIHSHYIHREWLMSHGELFLAAQNTLSTVTRGKLLYEEHGTTVSL